MKVYVSHSMDEGYFTVIEEASKYSPGEMRYYYKDNFTHYGFAEIPEQLYNDYLAAAEMLDDIESKIIGMMHEQNE